MEREKKIYRVTLMGSIVNVMLLAFKFIAGILGHSAAMIADAVHSLSDFLTDRKMSIIAKRRQLCLVDAGGDILWLVGHRIHERYKISGDTIKAIVVRYIQ